jgi:imidazolonepropionase-like amidohydrolase
MHKYLLAGAAALAFAAAAHAETYAIQAGRLIVDAAQPARGNSTVIVENGHIARIEAGFTAPQGATVVNEQSRTVMPGMTDVHVHLTQNSGEPWYVGFTKKYSNAYGVTLGLTHALDMARAGFTTVRDLGGDTNTVIAVRDAVGEGRFPGPRIKVSGAPLSIIGGHADEALGCRPSSPRPSTKRTSTPRSVPVRTNARRSSASSPQRASTSSRSWRPAVCSTQARAGSSSISAMLR